METHFAIPERSSSKQMQQELELMSNNPIIDSILKFVPSVLAVLNENRQILLVNDKLLQMLNMTELKEVVGLRPGEAIKCVHADEEPAGCGTSKYCSTCGAAIAIVTSLAEDNPKERLCAIEARQNGREKEYSFKVTAVPFSIKSKSFILLFMRDITREHQRAALERVFFHDINNIMTGLMGTTQLLDFSSADPELTKVLKRSINRLNKEIDIQALISRSQDTDYQIHHNAVRIDEIVKELQAIIPEHKSANNKDLIIRTPIPKITVNTDYSLVMRVLTNMLTNAFEATDRGGKVKMRVEQQNDKIIFHVWNHQVIPQDIQKRIFQQYFSTKEEKGRGLGTYSMKLLGEKLLDGRVWFDSAQNTGTTFHFALPIK